jgi:UrcA family protein
MKTLLALAAVATLAAPAFAQPRTGSWQIGNDAFHIYYADLDVASRSGRAQLLRRVERAAERLCDADQACVADTVAQLRDRTIAQALADQGATRVAAR